MKPIFQILILVLIENAAAQNGWFWQYPKPQGNALNNVFIIDENTAVAVGELGTVIKTTDGGDSWDVQHYAGGISENLLDVYFIDENIGWAVGGNILCDKNGVILKTTNGGKTWFSQYADSTYFFSCVYFFNPDTGWVFGEDGIYLKTTNGGISWESRILGYAIHKFTSLYFISSDTGWVVGAGFYGNELFKTTDGGQQWIQQHIEPRVWGLQDIHFIDQNMGFIVCHFGSFLKTIDGGKSWESYNLWEKYQQEKYQFFYSVYFVDPENGWIAGGDIDGYILKTSDGGQNWIEEEIEVLKPLYKIFFADKYNGWIVGQDGLIYRTTNSGENWVPQKDEKYGFSSIYFIDENTGWAVGEKGIILYTEDGGANWIKQNQNDSLGFSSVYAIDNQNVFAVGAVIKGNWPSYTRNGVISQTTNGGQTWGKQTVDTLTEFSSIIFTNDSTGWITVTNGTLLRTTNKGNSWEQSSSGFGTILDNIQFIDESTGWISFYRGNIVLKTKDRGENWIAHLIDSTAIINSLFFTDKDIGWAAGNYRDNKNIYKTTDGGRTWHALDCIVTYNLYSVYFVNQDIGWTAGYNPVERKSYILKTNDSGENWIVQQSPTTDGIATLFFINENTGWAVGNGIFKTTTGGTSVHGTNNHKSYSPEKIELFQNYPNPFNFSTTIHYNISKLTFVSLKVIDLLGREVEKLVDEWRYPGNYAARWNAEHIPSGLYFYQLNTSEVSQTNKMILIK